MCIPLPMMAILSTGMSVASGVAQYSAQAQAAKEQARAQQEASRRLSKKRDQRLSAERLSEAQIEESMAIEALQASSESHVGMATIMTSAEEGGTAGNVVGQRVDEYRNLALNTGVLQEMQLRMNRAAQLMAFQGADLAYTEEWIGLNPAVQGPDLLGTVLGTGQQVMGTWQDFSLRQDQRANWGRQDSLYEAQLRTADSQTRLSMAQTGNLSAQAGLTRLRTQTERLNRENARLQGLTLRRGLGIGR